MRKVKIHKYAGILSAYGLALADVVVENQESFLKPLNEGSFRSVQLGSPMAPLTLFLLFIFRIVSSFLWAFISYR